MNDFIPPHSLDAETSVLGAVLVSNGASLPRARRIVTAEDFYRDPHRRIFRAMAGLGDRGTPIDPVTLTEELARRGDLDTAGGPAGIALLLDGVPLSSNVEHYARIVKELALQRAALEATRGYQAALAEGNGSIPQAAERLRQAIEAERAATVAPYEIEPIRLADFDPAAPVPALFGDPAGEVAIPAGDMGGVVAEPGIGKTLSGIDVAIALRSGEPFLGFSCAARGRALVLAADGDGEAVIRRRAARLALGRGLSLADLDGDELVIAAPDALCLDNPAHYAAVEALVGRLDPDLIVLDSLNILPAPTVDLTVAQSSVGFIKSRLRPLQNRPDGSRRTMLLLHHLRKRSGQPGANSIRDRVGGSYAIVAGLDFVLALEGAGADGFTVKIVKPSRTGSRFAPFRVRIEGGPTEPLRLTNAGQLQQSPREQTADENLFLEALSALSALAGLGPDGWCAVADVKRRAGIEPKDRAKGRRLERAGKRLADAGTIEAHATRRGLYRLTEGERA